MIKEDLRSCTSLAALTFESANALLAPFRLFTLDLCWIIEYDCLLSSCRVVDSKNVWKWFLEEEEKRDEEARMILKLTLTVWETLNI